MAGEDLITRGSCQGRLETLGTWGVVVRGELTNSRLGKTQGSFTVGVSPGKKISSGTEKGTVWVPFFRLNYLKELFPINNPRTVITSL